MDTDDAVLVAAVRAGDRPAFGAIYDRYGDRLYDFCWGLLRDRDEAADAVHDTFLIAVERIGQLRDPTKLRAWLFAIARHEAGRRGIARGRERPEEVLPEMAAPDSPADEVVRGELAELVWRAAEGLEPRDRVVLELNVRQGLDVPELAAAMGVTPGHASVLLNRMRERVERSLGAILVARLGRRDCPELQHLLAGWDGRLTPLWRKRIAHHADSCEVCDRKRRGALNPLSLYGLVAAVAAPPALRDRVMQDVEQVAARRRPPRQRGWRDGFPPPMRGAELSKAPSRAFRAAGVAAIVAAVLGWTLYLMPETRRSAAPGAAPSTATATPSLQPGSPSGTASPTASQTPTTPAAPGRLTLSAGRLDFGGSATSRAFVLRNEGGEALAWSAAPSVAAVTVEPRAGTLSPGSSATLTATLDRTGVPEGSLAGVIEIASTGGDARIDVVARIDRLPAIGPVSSARGTIYTNTQSVCSPFTTTVFATVTDESEPLTVRLHWDQDGVTGSRAMSADGDDYSATIGAFSQAKPVRYWVVATDARRNTSRSPDRTLKVQSSC